MSDHGYIKFYRSTLTHPFFRDDVERMAWLRLLSAAAWKPYKTRAGEFFVELQRGEVVAAVRYLADEWSWSKGKVERFLNRLKNEAMIGTRTETGITIITICKYNEYQGGDDDDGTAVDQEPGQARDTAGTEPGHARDRGGDNRKETKQLSIEEMEEGKAETGDRTLFGTDLVPLAKPPAVQPDFEGMFQAWFAVYPKKVDPDDALRVFTRVVKSKKVTFEQLLAGARRYAMETQAERTERRFIKAPAVWLNKGSWKNEAGAQATDKQPSLAPRAATGIAGIMSRITEEDFNDGNR